MLELNDPSQWKKSLGLLPIRLFSDTANESEFILLNGGTGDFCIDIKPQSEPEHYYSSSWSCDTINFVSVKKNKMEVYNWNKGKVEEIDKQIVKDNMPKFYSYLISNSIKTENDIVPFVLKIFRKLRNLIDEKKSGTESLNLLFLLLAAYEENNNFTSINKEKWGLSNFTDPTADFEKYLEEFGNGISPKINLKPKVELILRHSSGALFQEAQQEALIFNKNIDLFSGTLSDNYDRKKILYSSIHYTPAYIARTIVETSLNNLDISEKNTLKIFDPACGSSEFLMETLKQLKSKRYQGNVKIIGWDSSESAINTSRFLLTYEKREWGDKLEIELKTVEDSLKKEWENDYDLILMNPPYMSWEQMSSASRESVESTLGSTFSGKPNQASAFLYKAICNLKTGSVIGSVIPSSILTFDSYKKLRNDLKESISPLLIGKLGNFIFDSALTDVSLFIGKKPKSNEIPLILWTKNEKGVVPEALIELRKLQSSNISSVDKPDYSIYRPITYPIGNDNWKALSLQDNKIYKKLESLTRKGVLTRVKEIFYVRQGIRTGNNKVFKVPLKFYENIIQVAEKKYFKPAIDNDSISDNAINRNAYVWYPYDENGSIIEDEEQLKKLVPEYYKLILHPNKERLSQRALEDVEKWWNLNRYRSWLIRRFPKLISTEFGNSKSFAFDKNGEYVIERGNGWIPKEEFNDVEDFYFYLAIFSSSFFNTLLSIYSKQLAGGGWYDLGNKYMKNIPIPKITEELKELGIYNKFVKVGTMVSDGDVVSPKLVDGFLKDYIYLL